jgi:hypothetical protein
VKPMVASGAVFERAVASRREKGWNAEKGWWRVSSFAIFAPTHFSAKALTARAATASFLTLHLGHVLVPIHSQDSCLRDCGPKSAGSSCMNCPRTQQSGLTVALKHNSDHNASFGCIFSIARM